MFLYSIGLSNTIDEHTQPLINEIYLPLQELYFNGYM